jgi:ribonuclease P protein component
MPPDARATFRKHEHLRRPADFRRVFDQHCSAADPALIVHARANDLPHTRLGLSVSRRVGPAVVRNRWRRLLREAFRLSKAALPVGLDLVIVARAVPTPTLVRLKKSLVDLAAALARKIQRRKGS